MKKIHAPITKLPGKDLNHQTEIKTHNKIYKLLQLIGWYGRY